MHGVVGELEAHGVAAYEASEFTTWSFAGEWDVVWVFAGVATSAASGSIAGGAGFIGSALCGDGGVVLGAVDSAVGGFGVADADVAVGEDAFHGIEQHGVFGVLE